MAGFVTQVELEGVNGKFVTLSGEGSDDSATYLATGMTGFMDVPVTVLRGSHAFQEGSTYFGKRFPERLLEFGVVIDNSNGSSWMENDSEFRKMWDVDRDCKLWIETETSRRYLKIRPAEEFRFELEYDPNQTQIETVKLKCVAMDPWWYEDEYTDVFTSTENTMDGHFQSGTVTMVNPCDREVWPRWSLPDPSVPRLPDYSWGDKRRNGWQNGVYLDNATNFATRQIVMPEILAPPAGQPQSYYGVQVNTRPDALRGGFPSRDQTYGQRMKMVRFLYPIPPYTAPVELPVGISKAAVGARIQLLMPRPWSRPWGLE